MSNAVHQERWRDASALVIEMAEKGLSSPTNYNHAVSTLMAHSSRIKPEDTPRIIISLFQLGDVPTDFLRKLDNYCPQRSILNGEKAQLMWANVARICAYYGSNNFTTIANALLQNIGQNPPLEVIRCLRQGRKLMEDVDVRARYLESRLFPFPDPYGSGQLSKVEHDILAAHSLEICEPNGKNYGLNVIECKVIGSVSQERYAVKEYRPITSIFADGTEAAYLRGELKIENELLMRIGFSRHLLFSSFKNPPEIELFELNQNTFYSFDPRFTPSACDVTTPLSFYSLTNQGEESDTVRPGLLFEDPIQRAAFWSARNDWTNALNVDPKEMAKHLLCDEPDIYKLAEVLSGLAVMIPNEGGYISQIAAHYLKSMPKNVASDKEYLKSLQTVAKVFMAVGKVSSEAFKELARLSKAAVSPSILNDPAFHTRFAPLMDVLVCSGLSEQTCRNAKHLILDFLLRSRNPQIPRALALSIFCHRENDDLGHRFHFIHSESLETTRFQAIRSQVTGCLTALLSAKPSLTYEEFKIINNAEADWVLYANGKPTHVITIEEPELLYVAGDKDLGLTGIHIISKRALDKDGIKYVVFSPQDWRSICEETENKQQKKKVRFEWLQKKLFETP